VDPTNALAIQALRDEYSSRQVYDSAIALARRDVELRPGVPQRLHLVRYLTVDDQFDEAGAILDSIAVESPAAAATGAYLFVALQLALRQGDSERALLFSQHMSRLSQPTFRATGLEALS